MSERGTSRLEPVTQIAYRVDDLHAAVEYWVRHLGVGPFFRIDHPTFKEILFEGEPISPNVSLAFAWRGDLQIELMQQHCETRSAFQARPGHGGVHHVGIRTTDLAAGQRRLLAAGMRRVQWATAVNGTKTAFFEGGSMGGMVELIESADKGVFLTRMQQAALNWDGSSLYGN